MYLVIPPKQVRRLIAAHDHKYVKIDTAGIAGVVEDLINAFVAESGLPVDETGEPLTPLPVVEFVYVKPNHYSWREAKTSWRTIRVTEEDETYIKGYDGDEFKCFLKERILDGKIIRK